MAYIGNTGTTQSFSPAIDYFNGDGSTTAFTLSRTVATAAQVQVVINNVPQAPNSAFTVVGNTVTFTSAPPSGSGNIYVYYTTINSATIAPSQGTVNTTTLSTGGPVWDVNSNLLVNSIKYTSWTTAGRPATPTNGQTGWNSTLGQSEIWNGSAWTTIVLATNPTITGLTFTSASTAAPAFSAYQSSAQTLSNSTTTKIQFQTKLFDTNNNFDNTTNYRFTPTVAGYYQVNAVVQVAASFTGGSLYLYKNGSYNGSGMAVTATGGTFVLSYLIQMNGSTDYIEIYANIVTGQALVAGDTVFQAAMIRST